MEECGSIQGKTPRKPSPAAVLRADLCGMYLELSTHNIAEPSTHLNYRLLRPRDPKMSATPATVKAKG